jgi:hypothetical protein
LAQAANVWVSWQTVPTSVHWLELQVHDAVAPAPAPLTVHVWCAPHVAVVTHWVQPFARSWQVCAPPAAH